MNPIVIAIPVGIGLWLFSQKSSAAPAVPSGVKPPVAPAGKSPAQRMAEVIATGDPATIRAEAALLRKQGYAAEATELERVAGLIAAELGKGNAAPPVVQVPAAPSPAATLPGVPASLQGATLRKLSPAPFDTRVETVQNRLIALGYTQLKPADGKFGPATETVVKAFQSSNGLPADGVVGALTLVKLYGNPKAATPSAQAPFTQPAPVKPPAAAPVKPPAAAPAPAPVKPPAAAPASATGVPASLQGATLRKLSPAPFDTRVETVQNRLIALGYTQLKPADGKFGPATETVVKAFQASNGLPADGVVGALTLVKLYGATAKGPAPAAAAAAPAKPPAGDGKAPTITAALKSAPLLKNGKATGFKAPASSGQAVKDWQQVLFDLGFLQAKPDGKFGDATEVGTKAFQTAANSAAAKSGKPKLTVDGIVGPATVARAAEARVMSTGPATFTGDFFGDDSGQFSVPSQPLADSPLPGIMPPMAPVPPSASRALAARLYNMLELAPRGGEDRTLVALFQSQEGLRPTGFYGPAVAVQLARGYGIVPPKPLYWTESRTRQSKSNYRDAMRMFGEKDPQRVEEWRRAGDV